jgi:hypothetical protein
VRNMRRLSKLEAASYQDARSPEVEDSQESPRCDEFYAMEAMWTALHPIRGLEPHFSIDEEGAFRTKDGELAVNREHMDLQTLTRRKAEEYIEAMSAKRWEHFLEADEEAAELLERLLALADGYPVPEAFEPPLRNECAKEVVDSFEGTSHKLPPLFVDAEEREATRQLTVRPDTRPACPSATLQTMPTSEPSESILSAAKVPPGFHPHAFLTTGACLGCRKTPLSPSLPEPPRDARTLRTRRLDKNVRRLDARLYVLRIIPPGRGLEVSADSARTLAPIR